MPASEWRIRRRIPGTCSFLPSRRMQPRFTCRWEGGAWDTRRATSLELRISRFFIYLSVQKARPFLYQQVMLVYDTAGYQAWSVRHAASGCRGCPCTGILTLSLKACLCEQKFEVQNERCVPTTKPGIPHYSAKRLGKSPPLLPMFYTLGALRSCHQVVCRATQQGSPRLP